MGITIDVNDVLDCFLVSMGYKIEKNKVFYNKSSYTRLKELATQSKKETKEITIKDPRLLCFHVLNLKKTCIYP